LRNLGLLALGGLVLGVVMSLAFQRGTEEDRLVQRVRYPSRFMLIFSVTVVVVLVGSFFLPLSTSPP
jgi:hypothetical protein